GGVSPAEGRALEQAGGGGVGEARNFLTPRRRLQRCTRRQVACAPRGLSLPHLPEPKAALPGGAGVSPARRPHLPLDRHCEAAQPLWQSRARGKEPWIAALPAVARNDGGKEP